MKKLMLLGCCAIFLSGCQLLSQPIVQETPAPEAEEKWMCQTESMQASLMEFCEVEAWAKYFIATSEIEWPARKEQIESLSEEPYDLMQQILLSQGNDTPYRYRLRAQNKITALQNLVDENFAETLEIMIYKPSQQMLEMESAITILSRVNARQEKELESMNLTLQERQVELEKQRQQVEQLLKIEANMVDQNRTK